MKKKIKNLFKNTKKTFLDNFTKIKTIYKENKIVFYYILGSLINGILLRAFTVGNFYSITPFLADLFISIIFASFYFSFKENKRFTYLIIVSILSVIICLANIVYYSYYNSFISITFISFIITNHETGDANVLGNLLNIKYFVFLWFPIFLYFINKKIVKQKSSYMKKTIYKTIYYYVLILFILFISTLKGVDYSRFYTQWNREYSVTRFGVYLYQVNDIVKSIESKTITLFGTDKAYRKINEYYDNKQKEYSNEMSNIFKDKNIIAIHAESMQNVVINRKINGTLIAPNLSKLAKQGIYFNNFYSQVSFGTSSDTEFTYATSLLPVKIGTVFNNYYNSSYVTTYSLLKDKGYYTFCMHANNGDFWNRNLMYKSLGYDKFYEKSSYDIDETIGFGLSDKSFVLQSVDYIEQIAKEHEKFYGTLITLSNHTPFSYDEHFTEFNDLFGDEGYKFLKDTKLGDYFVSVNYADEQIGLLIEELDKRNLLDNTIVVIYGDHDARISSSLWEEYFNYDEEHDIIRTIDDKDYISYDYYENELNRSVPFIIWSKGGVSQTITTAMGMYDVLPTLGNMIGISSDYSLGSDIFNHLEDNIVVFPNGNFLTNYVYYNDSKNEYKPLTDIPLNETYIEKNKSLADEKLDVSNNIIIYNYFNKILSNKKYEVEKWK